MKLVWCIKHPNCYRYFSHVSIMTSYQNINDVISKITSSWTCQKISKFDLTKIKKYVKMHKLSVKILEEIRKFFGDNTNPASTLIILAIMLNHIQ